MKVLFVCTGNVFRSVSAHYSLKQYLEVSGIKDVEVDSAGTGFELTQWVHPTVERVLKGLGISVKGHVPKQLTEKEIRDCDIVICMAKNHKKYIRDHFGIDSFLFNSLAGKGETSVDDVNEALGKSWKEDPEGADRFFEKTVNYIHDEIPLIYEKVVGMED